MRRIVLISLILISSILSMAQKPVTEVEIDSTRQIFRKTLSAGTQVWLRDSSQIYRLNVPFAAGSTMENVFANSSNYDLLKAGVSANMFTPAIFEKELSEGETEVLTSFSLNLTSVVFINGIALQSSDWTGVGTQTLNLLTQIKQYDKLMIKK